MSGVFANPSKSSKKFSILTDFLSKILLIELVKITLIKLKKTVKK